MKNAEAIAFLVDPYYLVLLYLMILCVLSYKARYSERSNILAFYAFLQQLILDEFNYTVITNGYFSLQLKQRSWGRK